MLTDKLKKSMASGPSGDSSPNNVDIPRGLINRTGTPIGRGSRLPSVRGNRDLTLGGIQKKVFKPNLAAVKKASNKEEISKQGSTATSSSSEKQEDGKSRDRGRSERGRGRGRGRGQFEDRTIQLQSEFAFGPTGKTSSGWCKGSEGGRGGGGKSSETDSTTIKSALKISRDTEEDKKLLKTLMRDDFISDLSLGDPHMVPVQLPLNLNRGCAKLEVKTEIKEEVMDIDETDTLQNTRNISTSGHRTFSPPATIKDIFTNSTKSEKGELLFIQFPDTLPGLPGSLMTDDKPTSSTNSNSGGKEEELVKRLSTCQLKDCSEGYVGKLRIYDSGRTQLILGDNVMDVLPGIPINFHQELVSIHTDDNPGQMIVLGPVNHKLVVTPDYNDLLSHVNKFS